MLKESCRAIFYFLYWMLPKFGHAVIWGWPDGEDSSRALVDGLLGYRVSRIIVLMTDPSCATSGDFRIRYVRKSSIAGLFWFLTARYVFFTHRCFMKRFPPNVVSVNVWHGMPIKRIGWLLEGDDGIDSRYVLATSDFWGGIMRQAMCPKGQVLITGLPRNDRLFCNPAEVWGRLVFSSRPDIQKLAVWLPTYRHSVWGCIRQDGSAQGGVFGAMTVDRKALNDFLAAHRLMMFVKPHPLAAFDGMFEFSHLRIVDDAWLRSQGVSLYQLLGVSHLLVSDISSVTVDFLLLDRPIIHCFPDIEAYREDRGFTVEPVEDLLAGPVVTSFSGLLDSMRDVLNGNDSGESRRRTQRDRFHQHKDSGATLRILDAIGLERSRSD